MNFYEKGIMGMAFSAFGIGLDNIEQLTGLIKLGSMVIGMLSGLVFLIGSSFDLYRKFKGSNESRIISPRDHTLKLFPIFLLLTFLSGCTFSAGAKARTDKAVDLNAGKLDEQSRMLTTGIADALSVAPTNPPVNLALEMARKDQQIEGMPRERIDVKALLEGNKEAQRKLDAIYVAQSTLLDERATLTARLKETEARLIEMGQKYEAERNTTITKRIWRWGLSTLGVGGLIALCVFFPAIIPVIGNLFGFIVGKLPGLAGMFGVVSKKAFDGVITGVQNFRVSMKETSAKQMLDTEMLKATDESHRKVIAARKVALAV